MSCLDYETRKQGWLLTAHPARVRSPVVISQASSQFLICSIQSCFKIPEAQKGLHCSTASQVWFLPPLPWPVHEGPDEDRTSAPEAQPTDLWLPSGLHRDAHKAQREPRLPISLQTGRLTSVTCFSPAELGPK